MTQIDENDVARVAFAGGLTGMDSWYRPSDECLVLAGQASGFDRDDTLLLAAFEADNADTRSLALSLSIVVYGPDEPQPTLAHLVGLLEHDPYKIAALGAMSPISLALGIIALNAISWGPPAISAAVSQRLDDSDPLVRGRAALALGAIGSSTELALHPLLRMLREEPAGEAVVGAVLGLVCMTTDSLAPVILPRLRESARADPDWQVRGAASWALGLSASDDPIGLRDIDDRVKSIVFGSNPGNLPPSHRPEIMRILRDPDAEPFLRLSAAAGLLDDGDPELADTALQWLARYRAEEAFVEHVERIDLILELQGRRSTGETL